MVRDLLVSIERLGSGVFLKNMHRYSSSKLLSSFRTSEEGEIIVATKTNLRATTSGSRV